MNSDLLKGLNEHLKLEFRAAHEYLAMSVWLSVNDLPGFSKWMKQQSAGELTHAQRIMDHLVDRDEQPVLPGIPAPPKTWKSLEALCQHVLKNEREVTASINELCAGADKAKDRAAAVMLQWFVTEQIEEEAARARRARPHPPGRQHGCGRADGGPGTRERHHPRRARRTAGRRRAA